MSLAHYVDVVFPSLYTTFPNEGDWVKYATENLRQARLYGKKVYAFLWPEYNENSKLKGQRISAEFWRIQLETCRRYADGIVIWGGWQKEWDETAPWWIETKEFMRNLLTK